MGIEEWQGAAATRIRRLIDRFGPIPISLFMAEANGHYYATRDPFGVAGDFTTAPEISQMFGELVGLWCADLLLRAAGGDAAAWVELGPGRGTLALDALRALRGTGLNPPVHLVETSPVLRDLQAARLPAATLHRDVEALPTDRPLVIVANEFFDAMPVRQIVRTPGGWREKQVAHDGARFVPTVGSVPLDALVPPEWADQPDGTIIESAPAAGAIIASLAARIVAQGGALLIADYGHAVSAPGDTLQAVARHAAADIFADPGERDLTAHVDFAALAAVARGEGAAVHGPATQGAFLTALGLTQRRDSLIAAHPDRAAALTGEAARLVDAGAMGALFKVMAITAPGWPVPEGFAA